ncbi:MAG: hypothetical protein JNK58_11910 [Phycisphaerae bacterium]|nr:hypothetical protein [Phycisphaerae bacterium]
MRALFALPLLISTFFTLSACQEAPRGDSGGRVSVGSTTPGEANSGLMRTADLVTASDDVALALAQDVDQMVTQDFTGQRVTIVFGDLMNKTSKMSTTDFEFVRDRIKSKLMDSRIVRDNARFVENRSRRESLRQRELGQTGDQKIGHTSDLSQPAVNEEFFLFLNGNMYSVDRPDTRLYYLKFELMRSSTGETVFSKDYEVKYGR